jgi:hypothetical protein
VVLTAGCAYRLGSHLLVREFNRAGPFQGLLLRYTQALITQMAQTAVCNRHHSIEQQFCRWLLLTLDRLPSPELVMTQELVASMLGVRRESITDAARNLREMGFIRCRRGHISVLDRAGLEQRSCECYAVVRMEINRLLSDGLQRRGATIGERNTEQQLEQACGTVYDQHEEQDGNEVTCRLDGREQVIHMDEDPGWRIPVKDGRVVVDPKS